MQYEVRFRSNLIIPALQGKDILRSNTVLFIIPISEQTHSEWVHQMMRTKIILQPDIVRSRE